MVWTKGLCINFYCCVTNHHKFSSLKQHILFFHSFPRSAVLEWLCWVLHSGFHKTASKALTGLPSYLSFEVFFQVQRIVYWIYFLSAVEFTAACFFKASRERGIFYYFGLFMPRSCCKELSWVGETHPGKSVFWLT